MKLNYINWKLIQFLYDIDKSLEGRTLNKKFRGNIIFIFTLSIKAEISISCIAKILRRGYTNISWCHIFSISKFLRQ